MRHSSVPGLFIRVREGDMVEFYLENHPTSKMPHNIDLHAVTGPGGGAASSFTAPVGMHVANGMDGLIFVEPQECLPPVD